MKTSIITTISHNVGDDFVREGILFLLNSIKADIHIEVIHKHSPVTAVYGWEKLRKLRASRLVEPLLRFARLGNRISDADLLVQSGAPVYWCHPGLTHCADNEWFDPLIRKRFLHDRRGRKFLNIAGGSCQSYHSDGSELDSCPKCREYIREFYDACDLTILRDALAKSMLNKVGRDAEVLPCTSIFAKDYLKIVPTEDEYIVLNFMENGGHYTFGQKIDQGAWREQFKKLVSFTCKLGRVVIACHTREEEALAKMLAPEVETFLVPDDHVKFIEFYSRAKFGVVNRVHAAFMMASMGKPVAVIGNDSRALMIKDLNLPSFFVEDVKKIGVENIVASISTRVGIFRDEAEEIRAQSFKKYKLLLSDALEA